MVGRPAGGNSITATPPTISARSTRHAVPSGEGECGAHALRLPLSSAPVGLATGRSRRASTSRPPAQESPRRTSTSSPPRAFAATGAHPVGQHPRPEGTVTTPRHTRFRPRVTQRQHADEAARRARRTTHGATTAQPQRPTHGAQPQRHGARSKAPTRPLTRAPAPDVTTRRTTRPDTPVRMTQRPRTHARRTTRPRTTRETRGARRICATAPNTRQTRITARHSDDHDTRTTGETGD